MPSAVCIRPSYLSRKMRKLLILFGLAFVSLTAYLNRRRLGVIVSNTYGRGFGAEEMLGGLMLGNVNVHLTEEGDVVSKERNSCNRVWKKGTSPWFDRIFNDSISPIWTRSAPLNGTVEKWWLHLYYDGERNVPKLLNTLFQLIPDVNPYQQRDTQRCVRCATIGNSGNLKNSKYGKLIDSHHRVFRVNHAPTIGYENDVGKRTTHRITYPVTYTSVANDTHYILIPYGARDLDWLISAMTDGQISWTYSPVPRFIDAKRSKVMIYNPALMYDVKMNWVGEDELWPSTGLMMLLFALHICDEVNVFGFGASSYGAWDHYWELDSGPWNYIYQFLWRPHKSSVEKAILERLSQEGKIKVFRGVR